MSNTTTNPLPERLTGHTSGPWRYQEKSDAYTHIVRAGDQFLCQFAQGANGEPEANARLVAATPDLLAALWGLLDANYTGSLDKITRAESVAVAALRDAKATA